MVLAIVLAAAEGAAEAKPGLPQLDPTIFAPQLIWLALTFAVLYFTLSTLILPRIERTLEERRERIQRDIDEAERLKGETETAIADYEQKLAAARSNASQISKQGREALNAELDAERAEVDEQINAKVADAEQRIADMKQQALTQVDTIASDTAAELISKLSGTGASADEINAALQSVRAGE